MIVDLYTKIVLTIIAASLFVLSLTTIISPINVYAEYEKKNYARYEKKKTLDEKVRIYGVKIIGLLEKVRDINASQRDKTAQIYELNKNIYELNKNIEDILLFTQHEIFSEGINVNWKNGDATSPVR